MNNNAKEKINFNYNNIKKIDGKYDSLITDIVCYIRLELVENDAEEAIDDILDMLLSAQVRGEDLYEFVGNDFKKFCDNIIDSYRQNSKTYKYKLIFENAITVLKLLPFFISLSCLTELFSLKSISLNTLLNANFNLRVSVIITSICLIVSINIILNLCLKPNNNSRVKNYLYLFAVFFITMAFPIIFSKVFSNPTLISIPNYLICLVISIVIIVMYIPKLIQKKE
ncbi:hypothetical protein [Clostridium chrysemydis]|uniref:hypothetical protein n=1 Tax=Clostridium chrysemydis TaxID=2665504 RepID=UPI0018833395|nr:hypothetical protein [Clostridium chrysemydis]